MYEHLMSQAEGLATRGGKPRQVDLRRAISAAYYAVFHLLVEESCCVVFGAQNGTRSFRDVVARAFVHSTMKQACSSFRGGNLKAAVVKGLPRNAAGHYAFPVEIKEIAQLFADLQEKRHMADYDRSERFLRPQVLRLLTETRLVVEQFQALPESPDRKFFLACLWAWKELAAR